MNWLDLSYRLFFFNFRPDCFSRFLLFSCSLFNLLDNLVEANHITVILRLSSVFRSGGNLWLLFWFRGWSRGRGRGGYWGWLRSRFGLLSLRGWTIEFFKQLEDGIQIQRINWRLFFRLFLRRLWRSNWSFRFDFWFRLCLRNDDWLRIWLDLRLLLWLY